MKCLAILLAAGESRRFGKDKIWLDLEQRPVWKWSFDTFLNHPLVDGVAIVGPRHFLEDFQKHAAEAVFIAEGGATRQESAYNGLKAAAEQYDLILFHDAARPFISNALITKIIDTAKLKGAACPGTPLTDTIKQKQDGIYKTVQREQYTAVQTPQAALRSHWLRAHQTSGAVMTDDVSLLETLGIYAEIVPGDKENIKLTTKEDYEHALRKISMPEIRTGLGYDIHSFSQEPNRPLFLGGVLFEGEQGLEGHSDADVVLHAVVDALLGAAGLGDIGLHYPNTDPRWKNADSKIFLKETAKRLQDENWQIINIDITVLAEHPKVMRRKEDIRTRISNEVGLDPSRINLKATTNEKLGAIGRGEGIAAFSVATIRRWV